MKMSATKPERPTFKGVTQRLFLKVKIMIQLLVKVTHGKREALSKILTSDPLSLLSFSNKVVAIRFV